MLQPQILSVNYKISKGTLLTTGKTGGVLLCMKPFSRGHLLAAVLGGNSIRFLPMGKKF